MDTINYVNLLEKLGFLRKIRLIAIVIALSIVLSIIATTVFFFKGNIISYGDAESHLNIAKRVIDSLTPGFSQLGGVWLPLPHVLMIPFVFFDPLWRTGLAGSLVSGFLFIISCITLYKLSFLITQNRLSSFVTFLVFALNPNILYLQSTPMTEIPLIAFMILSLYFFVKYIKKDTDFINLIFAAFFGFCATLTRYEGWFLVLVEIVSIILLNLKRDGGWKKIEGKVLFFSTLALFGVALWFLWDLLILGDPFYFTNSQFSAKSQQQGWMARGELPAYHNLPLSFLYFFITAYEIAGPLIFIVAILGAVAFWISGKVNRIKVILFLLLLSPFIFNVLTLFLGQSVIFIPDLTPRTFEWTLFNVRYGTLMIPTVAFFTGILYSKLKISRIIISLLIVIQLLMFQAGIAPVLAFEDGVRGLSAAKIPTAQLWLSQNYDGGLLLLDDYARTLSVLRTKIPMKNVIYVGNKPYWEESLKEPEKYARWIVIQKNDSIWTHVYQNPEVQGRLYKYFEKAYTSPEILIFKRGSTPHP